MCRPAVVEISNLVRLVFTLATGALFAASAGPTVSVLSGDINDGDNNNGSFSNLGVSVLVAGMGSSRFSQSQVYWSDVNTDNACQVGTPIYTQWSEPNGLCPPCRDGSGGVCFQLPPDTLFKMIMVFMTIGMAGILFVVELLDLFTCGHVLLCIPLEFFFSVLLLASAAMTFPFWTTTGLSAQLSHSQSVVPLFASPGSTALQPSQPLNMGRDHGYNIMIAGLACAAMTVLSFCLFPSKRHAQELSPRSRHNVIAADPHNRRHGNNHDNKHPATTTAAQRHNQSAVEYEDDHTACGPCCGGGGRRRRASSVPSADLESQRQAVHQELLHEGNQQQHQHQQGGGFGGGNNNNYNSYNPNNNNNNTSYNPNPASSSYNPNNNNNNPTTSYAYQPTTTTGTTAGSYQTNHGSSYNAPTVNSSYVGSGGGVSANNTANAPAVNVTSNAPAVSTGYATSSTNNNNNNATSSANIDKSELIKPHDLTHTAPVATATSSATTGGTGNQPRVVVGNEVSQV